MAWFFITFFIALMIFGVLLFHKGYAEERSSYLSKLKESEDKSSRYDTDRTAAIIRKTEEELNIAKTASILAVAVLVVVFLGITGFRVTKQIKAGEVGIVYQFGDIVDQRGEGLQFIAPWQSLKSETIRIQKYVFDGDNSLSTFSQETQDVFINATLNYSVSPSAVQNLYRTVGPDWFNVLVPPRVQNFFKEETVKYSTVDIAPNREVLRRAVQQRLANDLEQYSINVNDLLIDNLDFRQEFKNSIENKQIATQNALEAAERVKIKEAEANQAVATAEGKAREKIIAAEAQAEATVIRADAEANANRLISESLDENVLTIRAIEAFGDKIQIALIPSGEGLILDPATLLGASAPE